MCLPALWSVHLFTPRISSSCEEDQDIVVPTGCFHYLLVTAHTESLGFFSTRHNIRSFLCASFSSATQCLDLPQQYKVEKQILSVTPTKQLGKQRNKRVLPYRILNSSANRWSGLKTFPF